MSADQAARPASRAADPSPGLAAGPSPGPALAALGGSGPDPVLDIRDLSVVYRTPGGDVRAVDRVNLTLSAGEVVGLAGESGSGKSTLVYGACRLLRAPALITSGSVTYRGRRLSRPADCWRCSRMSCGGCAGARLPSCSRAR